MPKKAMQYGAVDFLSKPIDTKELTECLQKIVLRLRVSTRQETPFFRRVSNFTHLYPTS